MSPTWPGAALIVNTRMGQSIQILHRLADLEPGEWNALLAPDANPFMSWEWLEGLESSGSATPETGWSPHHLLMREEGRLVAAAPLYLKGHSQGEFVFDHSWANYAHRIGIEYYPKLLCMVPFTPVVGRRLLTDPAEPEKREARAMSLVAAMMELARSNGLSSVHLNFMSAEERGWLEQAGWLPRCDLQFHWTRNGAENFEDYLAGFRHSRRKEIKRERRKLEEAGVTLRLITGEEITPDLMDRYHVFYIRQASKFGQWGNRYLTQEFYRLMAVRLRDRIVLSSAWRDGELIAGALNIRGPDALYGRYWGALEELPALYFAVSYYLPIEFAIEHRLSRFEAGAGGDFKQSRGLEPVPVWSAHFLPDKRLRGPVAQYLAAERAEVEAARAAYREHSALKEETEKP